MNRICICGPTKRKNSCTKWKILPWGLCCLAVKYGAKPPMRIRKMAVVKFSQVHLQNVTPVSYIWLVDSWRETLDIQAWRRRDSYLKSNWQVTNYLFIYLFCDGNLYFLLILTRFPFLFWFNNFLNKIQYVYIKRRQMPNVHIVFIPIGYSSMTQF